MKLIIAIIQPSRLEDVKAALTDVEVSRLTVMDCQGFGRQKGQTEICLLYTSPSPRDGLLSRMPSSA